MHMALNRNETGSADGYTANLKIAVLYQQPLPKGPSRSAHLTVGPMDATEIESPVLQKGRNRWKGGPEKASEAAPLNLMQSVLAKIKGVFSRS
jgi:hypothetical protein